MGEDSSGSGVCPEGAATEAPDVSGATNNVIRIDEERIKGHLDRIVRASVEETLNALLDAEADRLMGLTVANAVKHARITAQAIISASCTPGMAR